MSRKEVADQAGLSEEQVARIEDNIDLPALAPLLKIARAMGVRLGTFLDDQEELGPVICRNMQEEKSISFSTNTPNASTHGILFFVKIEIEPSHGAFFYKHSSSPDKRI